MPSIRFGYILYTNRVYSTTEKEGDEAVKYPNIHAEMARKGLNQTALARQLGVNRRTVYNWIVRGRIPTDAVVKLSKFFGCSIDYLLSND